MKRIVFFVLCVALSLVFSSTSFAVKLVNPEKAPSDFCKVVIKGGKKHVAFSTKPIALSPEYLHKVLVAYGVRMKGDKKPVFKERKPMAMNPEYLDKVLAAYGLTLRNPEKAPAGYVKVVMKGGKKKIMWERKPMAVSPEYLDKVLAAYQ